MIPSIKEEERIEHIIAHEGIQYVGVGIRLEGRIQAVSVSSEKKSPIPEIVRLKMDGTFRGLGYDGFIRYLEPVTK